MSKFLIFNLCLAVAYILPIVMTEFSTYTCSVINLNESNSPIWSATDPTIKRSFQKAQSQCEKNSKTPEKCLIVKCEKSLFN